jgi:2Fe-2S ferredoxin
MPQLIVVTQDGKEISLEGRVGVSIMEHIRDAGVDELLALCGGCCSCATCHVYVGESEQEGLPAMSTDEDELLESSAHRCATSRLSCQVPFSEALDGVTVRLAPGD